MSERQSNEKLQKRVIYSLLGRIVFSMSMEDLMEAAEAIRQSCANEASRAVLRKWWVERKHELESIPDEERVYVDPKSDE